MTPKPTNEVDLQAFRWAVLAEKRPLTAEEQSEFSSWLSASSKHEGAYVRARATLLHLDRLGAMAGSRHVSSYPRVSQTTRRNLIAASLSAVGILGIGAWAGREWIADTWHETRYVTEIGQVRTIRLADGSAMTLNTATEALVRYGSERREVQLSRGEALFEVVHNAGRPFLVKVGELTVRAVGTAFAVRRESIRGEAKVVVTEGTVEMLMAARSAEAQSPHRLTTNQEAVIIDASSIEVRQISAAEVERRVAWRRGILVFDGQPLRDAVGEMNRYSRREIVIDDDELAARPVVGIFHVTDTDTFVSAVEFTLRARAVVSKSGDVVLLRSREGR